MKPKNLLKLIIKTISPENGDENGDKLKGWATINRTVNRTATGLKKCHSKNVTVNLDLLNEGMATVKLSSCPKKIL